MIRHWRPPDALLRRRLYPDHLTHLPLTYLSLRGEEYALAHALYPTDALAALHWSARSDRPCVFTATGIVRRETLASRQHWAAILSRAVRDSTAVVALSNAASESIRRWLGVRSEVIYPPVDLDGFRLGPARAERPTIFCPAAADDPRKRVGLLVEAFRLVRRSRPDARLLLDRPSDAGAAQRLLSASEGIGLVNVGADHGTLAGAYGEAWVTALPAQAEAFGLVLAESLACGTPVVADHSGAGPEIVESESIGRLFERDDAETLAATLLEALELGTDPATREVCRRSAQRFSLDRCAAAYEALYVSTLERR